MTAPITGVAVTRTPLTGWRLWRAWPGNIAALWRRSLRFRTLLVTIGLTLLAVAVACVWMALQIQNDLYTSRQDQVLADAEQARAAAQRTLDAAVQSDAVQLQSVMTLAFTALRDQSSAQMFAAYRIGPPVANAPQDFSTAEGVIDPLLTPAMREQVRNNPQ